MASVRKRADASPLQHAVQVSRMRFKSDRQGQRSYRGCHLLFLTGAAYQRIGKWVLAGAVLVRGATGIATSMPEELLATLLR